MSEYPYTIRPIEQWPGERTKYQKVAKFRRRDGSQTPISQTTALLSRELWYLAATSVVLQIDVRENQIRIDGGLYANAKPDSPAVILAFESKYGPQSYPCDTFYDWKDNLRAIALSLEALRQVDRYGVSKRGEQYTGWKALAPPADQMSPHEAMALLLREGGFRTAAKTHHPDKGGDGVLFRRITAAKSILEREGVPVP